MKKKLLFIFLLLISTPVFAASDCGVVAEYSKKCAQLIMIGAPILLILLSAVDILKAVASSNEKDISKCYSTIIKRVIICVIILLLPIIVNFIIGWTTFNSFTACW